MKTNEIRNKFLKFFEKKSHVIWPSDSLVPQNDPTLLFTGAGMNQFKDMFLGKGNLNFKKATTCQKCIRTGDIDNVGRTASHHTFLKCSEIFHLVIILRKKLLNGLGNSWCRN